MKKKLNVLLLFDSPVAVPRGYSFEEEFEHVNWETENDVYQALMKNGYQVRLLGIHNNIGGLLEEVAEYPPDVIFNLVEVFDQNSQLEKNVAGVLEMLGIPYTGASAGTLFMCNDKALTKKIFRFHRIKVPRFYTFYRGRKIKLVKRLRLPVIVKPLCEEASRGISQASVVDNEDALCERVEFIHRSMNADAIAEEYIDGREIYVGVVGYKRVQVLSPTEMKFGQLPKDEPRVATYKAKWDAAYRERWGIKNVFPGRLPAGVDEKMNDVCKKAYRVLGLRSYARFDLKVTADGYVYIIEANANPCLAARDEIAQGALKAGIPYQSLIKRIVNMALKNS